MAENTKDSKLFAEFPPVSTREWEEVIHKDLKGADYDKRLVWKTLEGFSVKPYYRAEDLEKLSNINVLPGDFPFIRGNQTSTNEWLVRQDFDASNAKEANAKAKDAITKGANSVGFETPHEFEPTAEGIAVLIEGINLLENEVNFVSGCGSRKILPLLTKVLKGKGVDISRAKGSFDYSPLTGLSLNGKFAKDAETAKERIKEMFDQGRELQEFKLIAVRGDVFRSCGASLVQELAFSLSMGSEYMTWMIEKGIAPNEAASKIKFNFAIGSSYFMEIAKFRAARFLWAKIVEAYFPSDIDSTKMCIHAVTSDWNKTIYDPYVNLLRTTTEAMSGALAGVNSLTVQPFDKFYQTPTAFSERIARNQQLIIKEEAYMNKVVDPAAGSYYIEMLTASIIQNAWNLFLKIDELGGYTEAFMKGFIQTEVKGLALKREANIAARRETVLGINQYPNFNEVINTKEIPSEKAKRNQPVKPKDAVYEPLVLFRGSQAFEEVRYRTDASGKRPKVFMLTLGMLSFRRARAQFSCNFFACGGFEVIDNIGFKTVDEGVKAALEAKSDMVVICSSDEDYETLAPEAFAKLNGKAIFVVAGEPPCKPDLEAKGIKNFISVKSNVLETLKDYQNLLKI